MWEYKIVDVEFYNRDKILREYSKDDWELVSVLQREQDYELFFKRPKESDCPDLYGGRHVQNLQKEE